MLEQADIINCAQEAIIIQNLEDDDISFWNEDAERLYDWSAEEAFGKAIGKLIWKWGMGSESLSIDTKQP